MGEWPRWAVSREGTWHPRGRVRPLHGSPSYHWCTLSGLAGPARGLRGFLVMCQQRLSGAWTVKGRLRRNRAAGCRRTRHPKVRSLSRIQGREPRLQAAVASVLVCSGGRRCSVCVGPVGAPMRGWGAGGQGCRPCRVLALDCSAAPRGTLSPWIHTSTYNLLILKCSQPGAPGWLSQAPNS